VISILLLYLNENVRLLDVDINGIGLLCKLYLQIITQVRFDITQTTYMDNNMCAMIDVFFLARNPSACLYHVGIGTYIKHDVTLDA